MMEPTKKRMEGGSKILFISYWSVREPLTDSTILPYLRIMSGLEWIDEVVLVTVERDAGPHTPVDLGIPKVRHIPFGLRWVRGGALSRLGLFLWMTVSLSRLVRRGRFSLIDAKASLAGGIAHLVGRLSRVPYMVESFEPHSEYMVDCGVWRRGGLYYRASRWLEQMQKRHARFVVTVTENYREALIAEGVPAERIKIIPSITGTERFALDTTARDRLRAQLGWQDAVVGVYVGKFGGLYYEREAFDVLARACELLGERARLALVTATPEEKVRAWLAEAGIRQEAVVVRFLPHDEVPAWLSMADYAFSFHRITPSSPYFSPVKNGEYWASGLPTLLPCGVSDDYRIVQAEPWAGAVFDPAQPEMLDDAVRHVGDLIRTPGNRQRIMQLAVEVRDIEVARRVYKEILKPALRKVAK